MELTQEQLKRFWSYIKPPESNDCWEWIGYRNSKGYGRFSTQNNKIRKVYNAHRAMWILVNGPIPAGLIICHHCDNPPCCNPSHLFMGSAADNSYDMIAKGRSQYVGMSNPGNKHPHARLTDEDVKKIRSRYASGSVTLQQLADEFGVVNQHISRIINRKQWTHI